LIIFGNASSANERKILKNLLKRNPDLAHQQNFRRLITIAYGILPITNGTSLKNLKPICVSLLLLRTHRPIGCPAAFAYLTRQFATLTPSQ
jgi:hypothetical protein